MSKSWRLAIPIFLILGALLIWKVTRNHQDPEWVRLKNLDLSQVETLEKSPGKLQTLFAKFQGEKTASKIVAIQTINKPYVPILKFDDFEKYILALQEDKKIIISAIEGGGSTTLIDRLARFVAIDDPERLLNVMCAPKFDIIYHKKYIGEEINGQFVKGKFLLFLEKAVKHPDQNYIAVFDDLDKINPETLFGPELWEDFGRTNQNITVGGFPVQFPPNFYMISSTLSAVGSRVHLHNEHFKRIGHNYHIKPDVIALALYLDKTKTKIAKKIAKKGLAALTDKDKKNYEALTDSTNILQFLYLFQKSNQLIAEKVSKTSQLAQWSNVRKLYRPDQRDEMIDIIINHVNAISPNKSFGRKDFDSIFYTFKNNGLLKGSNSLSTGFKVFKEWGFLTEFVVAICFALATALISIYFNAKRKKQVTRFLSRSEDIYAKFENRTLSTNDAIHELASLKMEIEEHTKNNKISFPEAIFFYNSVRSKVNSIEIVKSVNETFLILMDVFMEDSLLSKSEYEKLLVFLEKIELRIPAKDYQNMRDQVNQAWSQYGQEDD